MSSSLIMYLGAYPQGKSCLNFRSGNSSKESSCGQNMLIHIRCAPSVRFDTCILYIVNEHLTKKGASISTHASSFIELVLFTATQKRSCSSLCFWFV